MLILTQNPLRSGSHTSQCVKHNLIERMTDTTMTDESIFSSKYYFVICTRNFCATHIESGG